MLTMINWFKHPGVGRGFCLKDAQIEDKLSRCQCQSVGTVGSLPVDVSKNWEYLVKLSQSKVCGRSCQFCKSVSNPAACLILSKVVLGTAREGGFSSVALWTARW